jgi:hypothetical protein
MAKHVYILNSRSRSMMHATAFCDPPCSSVVRAGHELEFQIDQGTEDLSATGVLFTDVTTAPADPATGIAMVPGTHELRASKVIYGTIVITG